MKKGNGKPFILAVCGVRNSGKTTLITKLLPVLGRMGISTAVIKHDGHDFEPDMPGTDTWRLRMAGAFATAIYSGDRYMVVKEQKGSTPEMLAELFPEADLILLEGGKSSLLPKMEVIRSGNSGESVCEKTNLIAVVTDLPEWKKIPGAEDVVRLPLNDGETVAKFVAGQIR